MKLLVQKRGSVALMTALLAPVMIMTMALAVEVSLWSLTKVELQRTADVAAWAGARQYLVSTDAQSAANTAADLAEVNGAAGSAGSATNRSWNATTLTTTDNLITAQVVVTGSGVKAAADPIVKVTVKRNIAKLISGIFPDAQPSETIWATAVAEVVQATAGSQPCLFALKGDGNGITTGSDITFSGNATVTANNCSIRSDAGITLSGNSTLNVAGTYAGGTISVGPNARITGGQYPNSGQIPDPYATYAPLTTAFASLHSGVGAIKNYSSGTGNIIGPGTYASISTGGSGTILKMNPGLYIVNGNVSAIGNSSITGNGVTIISSGTLVAGGNASISLAAPLSGATIGIPGIMYASNSTLASTFGGNSVVPFAGVIYYPNGNMSFSGNAGEGATGCSEVIAAVITISGNSFLSANCSTFGTLTFGSLAGSTSIALVQ